MTTLLLPASLGSSAFQRACHILCPQATKELDPIARAVLSALCRSSYIRLPGSALLPALDDLPLAPQAWASSSLQCLHYQAGSSGCEAHEDRCLLTLIFAPGEPGLQVRAGVRWRHRPTQVSTASDLPCTANGPADVITSSKHVAELA